MPKSGDDEESSNKTKPQPYSEDDKSSPSSNTVEREMHEEQERMMQEEEVVVDEAQVVLPGHSSFTLVNDRMEVAWNDNWNTSSTAVEHSTSSFEQQNFEHNSALQHFVTGTSQTFWTEHPQKAYIESHGLSLAQLMPQPVPGELSSPAHTAAHFDLFDDTPEATPRHHSLAHDFTAALQPTLLIPPPLPPTPDDIVPTGPTPPHPSLFQEQASSSHHVPTYTEATTQTPSPPTPVLRKPPLYYVQNVVNNSILWEPLYSYADGQPGLISFDEYVSFHNVTSWICNNMASTTEQHETALSINTLLQNQIFQYLPYMTRDSLVDLVSTISNFIATPLFSGNIIDHCNIPGAPFTCIAKVSDDYFRSCIFAAHAKTSCFRALGNRISLDGLLTRDKSYEYHQQLLHHQESYKSLQLIGQSLNTPAEDMPDDDDNLPHTFHNILLDIPATTSSPEQPQVIDQTIDDTEASLR